MATRATDLEKLIKAAKSRGWQTVETKDGMVLRYPADCWGPGEGTCNLHRSPSASRTAANLRADLARVERLARDRAAARRREAATAAQRRDPAPDAEERAQARQRKAERRAARRLHNRRERQADELAGSLPPAPAPEIPPPPPAELDDRYPALADVLASGVGQFLTLVTGLSPDDFTNAGLAEMDAQIKAIDRRARNFERGKERRNAKTWQAWTPDEAADIKRRLDLVARDRGEAKALEYTAHKIRQDSTPEWVRETLREWRLDRVSRPPQRTDPTPLISSRRDRSNTERPTPGRPRRQA